MKNNPTRIALFIVTFSLCSFALHAADNTKAEKIFASLIAAQTAKDYDAFVADADDNLKAALTRTQFDAASNLINKRTSGGYDTTFLGELNQHGYQVFLYRLRFKDGGDDILGTMSLMDDKVGGIYFK
jgi:predicted naringenin-chalcone synthase